MTRNILIGTLFLICFSCSKKADFEPVYDVPAEYQPLVEKFIEEAALRGKNYNITNLIIRYDDDLEDNICGQCNSVSMDSEVQKIISINSSRCWQNDVQKEALIFHELGHCFLGRLHEEALLPNGDPKSMMIKDGIDVYSGCIYAFGDLIGCNKYYRRSYYLDELFDENTPVPDWAL